MRNEKSVIFDTIGLIAAYLVMTAGIHMKVGGAFNPFLGFTYWYKNQYHPSTYLIGVSLAGLGVGLLFWMFNPFGPKGEYGSSHFASKREAKRMGLLEEAGLIFGKAFGRYIRMNEPLSVLLIAPPGTGKTAGIVIPTLFSCGNSMVINDVKGELYQITSKRRATFSKVVKFSPGEADSACWNPLGKEVLPDDWNGKLVKVDRLAASLYIMKDESDYWPGEARAIFIFFALYLIWKNGGTSIPEVRSFALSEADTQMFIARLVDEGGPDLPVRIKEEGNTMSGKAEKEFSGIFGTFKSKLNAYADPNVSRALSSNDFAFKDFRKERHSVYLTIKAEDIERLSTVLRLFFEDLALYILSNAPEKGDHIITLLLDEFLRLGKLKEVLNMPALSRGNRGNALLIAQDYEQIKMVYGPEGPGILDGTTAYSVILAQNNQMSAELVSRKVGQFTRIKESLSVQGSQWLGSKSTSAEARSLLTPQDLMSMDPDDVYILAQNFMSVPLKAKRCLWFKDKQMKQLAGCMEAKA
jgi:type IV secretion system protein VirD4